MYPNRLVRLVRIPFLQGLLDLLGSPTALDYFLAVEMKGWNPIDVFLLPLFLSGVLDVDGFEVKWPLFGFKSAHTREQTNGKVRTDLRTLASSSLAMSHKEQFGPE